MYKVIFSGKSLQQVDTYTEGYRTYHENVYQDSGIWSEKQIIDSYIQESVFRYDEILDTISHKLSSSLVSYKNNQAVVRWRSKILLVSFTDSGDTRTITDLEIR